jgi:hypothetical protein
VEDKLKDKQTGGDESLAMLVQLYESAEQATEDSRRQAEVWRDYRNGDQWTAEEISTLNKRKQPVVTIDRIGPKVDFLLGMEAANRMDPKAYPRTPKEEQGAHAATDSLRFVADQNRWDDVRSQAFDSFIVEGCCGADVRIVDKYGEKCVEILPIMWDRMFYDPHSRQRNFSDAKFKGQFVWMDVDDAIARWPGKEDAIESTMAHESSAQGQTFDDIPRIRWADPKRKRVRIVEMWTHEKDGIYYSAFTKAGVLDRMPSPYVNEYGEQEDGFEFGSCYVDRDGNRFGVVKRWISLQDEINKRRSKLLHLVNVRQTFGNQTVGDKTQLRNEMAKPDGHVEMQGGAEFGKDFGVIPTNDIAASQFQLLQESKNEIDSVGVNAALSGTESRNMSGRALMARQEQGLNELGPVFDWFKAWQLGVYRKAWNRVRQYWTAEKWIRVTDDQKNVQFVGLNTPLTLGEQILTQMRERGVEVTPEMESQAMQSVALQAVVGTKNNVAELDVDITLDVSPATASLQIEEFQALADLAKSGVPIPPEALIEASSLRSKEKILEMMGAGKKQDIPPQVRQAMDQAQAEIQRLGQENQQLKSGLMKAQVEAQSRERIAASNNAASYDEAELKVAGDLLKAAVTPPPELGADVSRDIQRQG